MHIKTGWSSLYSHVLVSLLTYILDHYLILLTIMQVAFYWVDAQGWHNYFNHILVQGKLTEIDCQC